MSEAELDILEHEVEQARAKLADDLVRLRAPAILTGFRQDLWAQARHAGDDLVEKAKDAAKDGAQRVFADLRERAAANPTAALAIGAGVAWRLAHRPPIAALLVGAGLVSLLRTSPSPRGEPYMGFHDEDPELIDRARSIASRAAGEVASQAAEAASSVKETVKEWSASTGEAAREVATQIADKAASATASASKAVHEAMPDADTRDNYLLGAAALAVAAAIGIAYQRRAEGPQHAR